LLLAGTSLGLGTALPGCDSGPAPSTVPSKETPARAGAARPGTGSPEARASGAADPSAAGPILGFVRLGAPPWPTFDPFLFCVHHRDVYPAGNAALGPTESLAGRNIGQDFGGKDGWNMYHGDVVPGFPRHPHRGFETVTITRRGYVDHSDSLGATARYGEGDVQWLTAGSGIAHAEMFPLLDETSQNPTELFQIWLNLPARSKFVKPYFAMFWSGQIPKRELVDAGGRGTSVRVIAGSLDGQRAPSPPPDSWAAQADADVAIWSIRMQPGARWQLPAAPPSTERTLYFFSGSGLRVAERDVPVQTAVRLRGGPSVLLHASGDSDVEVLLLAGKPIAEPVVARGPFVMNDMAEIAQARSDYQRTQFGGWPWPKEDPVHPRQSGRFAIHANGKRERGV
ncbi:MAG TPA: pirin family protein, partial [Polyangiaceae bacterium]|nr:pirin family protein [Polyangiaceae bacterium]